MLKFRLEGQAGAVPIRVLLAEDNEDDVVIVRDVFKRSGASVFLNVACDGAEALSYLKRLSEGQESDGAPNLIFLDINMPKKNGFEVLEALQKNAWLKSIPAIMLSGSARFEDITQALNGGAVNYLIKPLTLSAFHEVVEQYLFPKSGSDE